MFPSKAGVLPFATGHHLVQLLGGVPHIGVADVQRREAKAQDVRVLATVARTEVTDHTPCDQGLHDGISPLGTGQADLRAALRFQGRGGDANPHGFSYLRRGNEDNIDLNRNCLDFDKNGATLNPEYASLHPLLIPTTWPPSEEVQQALNDLIQQMGTAAFKRAATAGQSSHSNGLFYSGKAPSWSNLTVRKILRQHGSQRSQIAWIDLHTGLGPRGHGEKIHAGRTVEDDLLRGRRLWGADVVAAWEGASTSAQVLGPVVSCVYEECLWLLPGYGPRVIAEQMLALNAEPPRQVMLIQSLYIALSLVRRTDALALMSTVVLDDPEVAQTVVALPLQEPLPELCVSLVSRGMHTLTPAARQFADGLLQATKATFKGALQYESVFSDAR